MPDDDTPIGSPIYDQMCVDLKIDDPLVGLLIVVDDHQVTVVDPSWFLDFDAVDSRTIRDPGAPQ